MAGGDWRATLFHYADLGLTRGLAAVRVVHEGVWLGLMGGRALDRATELYYRGRSEYRDARYNASGLLEWEERAFARYFGDCRSVLVGAMGGGREVLALCARGLRVAGFEPSPDLLESCRSLVESHGLEADLELSPPGRVPVGDEIFDGLIVGWSAYMHIPGRAARIRFLRELRNRVRPDGPILLSFFTRGADSRRDRWIQRIAQAIRRLRWSREPVEVGDGLAGSFDHYFTREEIETELAGAGFRLALYRTEPFGHAVGIAAG